MGVHKFLQEGFSLGNFLNTIQVGILFIDEEYKIRSFNKACTEIFKLSEAELKNASFINLLSEKTKDTFTSKFQLIVKNNLNTDSDVFELNLLNSQGEIVPAELNINSTLTISDQLYILVINDISQRKSLEKKVKDQIKTNEQIGEELEKVQELSELKSRFVTMASHEFRTPLAGVLSSINLAQRYLDAEEAGGVKLTHKSKIEKHFGKIRESISNLTQILNEFLSLGKLEEGKVQCHWEKVELSKLVVDVTGDLQKLCKEGQQIHSFIDLKKKTYYLDQNMIRNILNNLLSNAIKYSNPNCEIELTLNDSDDTIFLKVKDEGQGIPEEDQAKLFGRFFRAKNVTNIQGTGLGLNLVKRYVEMMGGTISFKSELNKGSTFTVLIPIKHDL